MIREWFMTLYSFNSTPANDAYPKEQHHIPNRPESPKMNSIPRHPSVISLLEHQSNTCTSASSSTASISALLSSSLVSSCASSTYRSANHSTTLSSQSSTSANQTTKTWHNTTASSLNSYGSRYNNVNTNGRLCLCTSLTSMDLDGSSSVYEHDVTGWEGLLIMVPQTSSQELSSGSETQVSKATSSHKPPYLLYLHKETSIGKSESKSSLKSYSCFYDPQAIPYQFSHCQDGDLSIYNIAKYRDSYTYPTMEQRLKSRSTSRLTIGVNPATVVHRPLPLSKTHTGLIKPKLIVLGEGSHNKVPVYNYTKKLQVGSRHSISKDHSDFLNACLQPSKGRYSRYESASSQTSTTKQRQPSAPSSSMRDRSESFPRDKACLKPVSEPSLCKELSMIREKPLLVQKERLCSHYSSREVGLCDSCIDSDVSVKWTSKSFPSFKVSSPNSSIAKSDSFQKSKSNISTSIRARRTHPGTTKQQLTPFNFLSAGGDPNLAPIFPPPPPPLELVLSKPMNKICPSNHDAKSALGQLLLSKPGFQNLRPELLCYMYEALCRQGHNTWENSSPSPIAITGP